MTETIKINDLTFSYKTIGNEFVLGPLNLKIPKGKLILFRGNNGSGKTTLAKILTKKIAFDNLDKCVVNLPKCLFYYNQSIEENIFPELTVAEHLSLFLKSNSYKQTELYQMFPEFDKLNNKYPDELSGGQNQLLGFCTILCKQFDLIVFDEILNHLDEEISRKVLNLIKTELVEKRQATVIVISHNIELLKTVCTMSVEFGNGKITKIALSTTEYFNLRAKRYAKSVTELPNARSLDLIPYCFLFHLAKNESKKIKVLDAFSGTGYIANSFNTMNADFLQVDASTGMLGENNPNKRCTQNDFVDIQQEFGNNHFDYIITHGGFHHIVETDNSGNVLETKSYNRQKGIIKRLVALLKPNGYLVIADIPNKDFSDDLGIFADISMSLSSFVQFIGNKKIETVKNFLRISDNEEISLGNVKTKIGDIIKSTKINFPIPRHFFDEYIAKETELGHIANYPDFDLIENWTKELVKKECQINFPSPWIFETDSHAGWFFKEKFSIDQETELLENAEMEYQMFAVLKQYLGTGNHNDFTFVDWGVTYAIYKKT
jgi:ABC-type multidrug transport system ATPase subunit